MILTCPSCGTQYVVKDGAIPPQGRQVRCASCKHSWHQDPEPGEAAAAAASESIPKEAVIDPSSGPEAEERAYEAAALASHAGDETSMGERGEADDAAETVGQEAEPVTDEEEATRGYAPGDAPRQAEQPMAEAEDTRPALYERERAMAEEPEAVPEAAPLDDDFSPFARREIEEPRRSPLVRMLLIALLIAAAAAAFWFLAPAEWKQRIGIAGAGETPLQLMMTHSDRQKLASGNELLAVSGRVINPTDEAQPVPPIQAQLRSSSGQLVYSWTIAPPARTLPPGASATFNSAEVNVPAGGDELTITLGSEKT